MVKKRNARRITKRRTVRKTRYASRVSYRLKEIPIKQIQVWKEAQARKLDRVGISELAKSIKTEGLQNPPMVQKNCIKSSQMFQKQLKSHIKYQNLNHKQKSDISRF